MTAVLDDDMRAVLAAQRLAFAATVTADGKPNLSPKGTIRVWDDHRLFFLDLASPGTRRNLATNPWMELNVVDPLSRRGYRFFGKAALHVGDEVHREAERRIAVDEGGVDPAHGAVLVALERIRPLVSPGYVYVPDEDGMRTMWKERRARLDAAFEEHLRARSAPR